MDNIENLEIKIAYLEDYVNQMNSVIIEQGKKIDRLIELNTQLRDKIELIEEGGNSIENRPPPHY